MPLAQPASQLLRRLRPWISRAVHVRWTVRRSFYQDEADALLMALARYQGRMPPDLVAPARGVPRQVAPRVVPARVAQEAPHVCRSGTRLPLVARHRRPLVRAEAAFPRPHGDQENGAPEGAAVAPAAAAPASPRPAAHLHSTAVPGIVAAVSQGEPSRSESAPERGAAPAVRRGHRPLASQLIPLSRDGCPREPRAAHRGRGRHRCRPPARAPRAAAPARRGRGRRSPRRPAASGTRSDTSRAAG